MLTKDPSLSIKVERSQSMCNQQTASRQLPAPSAFSVFLTKVEPGKRSKTAKVPRDRAAFMDLSKYQKDRKSTQDKLMCKQLMHLNWTKNAQSHLTRRRYQTRMETFKISHKIISLWDQQFSCALCLEFCVPFLFLKNNLREG